MYIPVWLLVVVALVLWWLVSTRASQSVVDALKTKVEADIRSLSETFEHEKEELRSDFDELRLNTDTLQVGARRVSAGQFVLVDTHGKTRATLGIEEGDSPTLSFVDQDGAVPTYLRHSPAGYAVLRLGNRGGEEIIIAVDTRVPSAQPQTIGVAEHTGPYAFVSVSDRDGFNTTIGRAQAVEEKIDPMSWDKLAAASVVMTKDREVLWSAP